MAADPKVDVVVKLIHGSIVLATPILGVLDVVEALDGPSLRRLLAAVGLDVSTFDGDIEMLRHLEIFGPRRGDKLRLSQLGQDVLVELTSHASTPVAAPPPVAAPSSAPVPTPPKMASVVVTMPAEVATPVAAAVKFDEPTIINGRKTVCAESVRVDLKLMPLGTVLVGELLKGPRTFDALVASSPYGVSFVPRDVRRALANFAALVPPTGNDSITIVGPSAGEFQLTPLGHAVAARLPCPDE